MANYLKMDKKQQIYGLLQLGWSYRRIEKETGVRRETVSRYHQEWLSKAAKVPTGSESEPVSLESNAAIPPAGLPEGRSTAHPYRDFIEAKLEKGREVYPERRIILQPYLGVADIYRTMWAQLPIPIPGCTGPLVGDSRRYGMGPVLLLETLRWTTVFSICEPTCRLIRRRL